MSETLKHGMHSEKYREFKAFSFIKRMYFSFKTELQALYVYA